MQGTPKEIEVAKTSLCFPPAGYNDLTEFRLISQALRNVFNLPTLPMAPFLQHSQALHLRLYGNQHRKN